MIDRRHITNIDWMLISVTLALTVIGIVNIHSATHVEDDSFYTKQILWLLISLPVAAAVIFTNYSLLEKFAYYIYGGAILLLIFVLAFGNKVAGAKRWLNFGFMNLQPSELAKIALVIALASFLSKINERRDGMGAKELVMPFLLAIIPFLLIAKQPDLGTALILFFIAASMTLITKIRALVLIAMSIAAAIFIPFAWSFLKDYQKARLMSFIDPSMDPLGTGYHTTQSKIAIGSGGFTGKGFLSGTQGSLAFLPEHHTDFVFASFSEEWGFFGSIIVMALFFLLIVRGIDIANHAKDRFGFLLAFGTTALIFWHAAINTLMVMGFMPVVGVPMPFLSYGGSFLLSTLIAVAILLNVHMRRFMF